MKLFTIQQVELWGDYGDVLVSGFYRRERPDSPALLHRSGPFLPPISFPWGAPENIMVVSDGLKSEMEASGIVNAAFRKTRLEKVIPIDWHTWDRTVLGPKRRPASGEPEHCLIGRKHSEETARKMEPAWECLLQEIPAVFAHWLSKGGEAAPGSEDTLLVAQSNCAGLFRSSFGGPPMVDDAARAWFQARVPGWVSFRPLIVVADPEAAQRLQAQRRYNALVGPHLTPAEYLARALALCQEKSYAVPAGISRPQATVSRYCVVLTDETPAKLSAASYDSPAALATYLDRRSRLQTGCQSVVSSLLIYDLELGRRLTYHGNNAFTVIEDEY